MFFGKTKAEAARINFDKIFSKKEFPDDAQEIVAQKETLLKDILIDEQIVESHLAFKRLVEQGAIRDVERNEKINDINFKIVESVNLKIGKRTFLKVKLK